MLQKICPRCGQCIKYTRYIKREFVCNNCGTELKLVSNFLYGHILGGFVGILFLLLLGFIFPPLLTSDGIIYAVIIIAFYMLLVFPVLFMKISKR